MTGPITVPANLQGSGTAWAMRENAKRARQQSQEAEAAKDLALAFTLLEEAKFYDRAADRCERAMAPTRRLLHAGVIRGRRLTLVR